MKKIMSLLVLCCSIGTCFAQNNCDLRQQITFKKHPPTITDDEAYYLIAGKIDTIYRKNAVVETDKRLQSVFWFPTSTIKVTQVTSTTRIYLSQSGNLLPHWGQSPPTITRVVLAPEESIAYWIIAVWLVSLLIGFLFSDIFKARHKHRFKRPIIHTVIDLSLFGIAIALALGFITYEIASDPAPELSLAYLKFTGSALCSIVTGFFLPIALNYLERLFQSTGKKPEMA